MQDARNLLFSTDYPMPVLAWEHSGSIADVGAVGTKSITIEHGLRFTPLLIGVWSTSSDFSPAYDIANYLGGGVINGQDMQLNQCGADDTNVYVEAFNASSSTKSLFFRLLAYAPPDYDGEVPNISDTTNFQFSTEYNYPKIVKAGSVTIDAGDSAGITHELGYIPQAKVWGPDAYGHLASTHFMRSPAYMNGNYGPVINADALFIVAGYSGKYYYHIYGDEV